MTEHQFDTEAPMHEEPVVQADYFGFQATEKYIFPDKITYIEFSLMNEGQKAKFQKKTSRDLVMERSGNTRMKVDQASERHELIKSVCVGWNLTRGGEPIPFNGVQLGDFLELTDPRLVENLEKAIRKANPWLLGDMEPEDIRKEIANLEEMLAVAEERQRGEGS